MLVGGHIAHSLIDYPGRPATVLFTQGCGWRCPYCHNPSLLTAHKQETVDLKTIFVMLAKRPPAAKNLVISGGEPTRQLDFIAFLKKLRRGGISSKLDTNGSRPDILRQVLDKKLVDYVAMDVKGPLETYGRYCGVKGQMEKVTASIELLKQSDIDYEFRSTVVPRLHQPEDFSALGRRLQGGRRLILQAFQARNALSQCLRESEEPNLEFLQACQEHAQQWLPCKIRS